MIRTDSDCLPQFRAVLDANPDLKIAWADFQLNQQTAAQSYRHGI